MPSETILIVEDVPESLKFAAGVLRQQGYKVQIASTAEQALSTLRFLQPNLILVDFMLPGMHGLELTTRVKQDPRLQKTLVVALTGLSTGEDEARAKQAGCDGYLRKPIDARTLATRVREFLEGEAKPAAPPPPEPIAIPADELRELQESFLKAGKPLSRQMLADLEAEFDGAKAQRTVHKWVGSAGLLDFPNVAYRARDVETILRSASWTPAALRGPLSSLARSFYNPTETSTPPSPATIRAFQGKPIALIGLSGDEADRVCGALEPLGARPRLFEAGHSLFAESVSSCALIVVHIHPGQTLELPNVPVLLLGNPEQLITTRGCIKGLLTDGARPDEIQMRFRLALSAESLAPARSKDWVVAVADDSSRDQARQALEQLHLHGHIAKSAPDAILLLQSTNPAGIIVDAGMGALEILGTARVRSLLLTGEPNETDLLHAFSLGMADYIQMPFGTAELQARLHRLT